MTTMGLRLGLSLRKDLLEHHQTVHSPSLYTGSVAYSNSHFDGARWDDTEGAAGTIGVLMMLVSGDGCECHERERNRTTVQIRKRWKS